MHIWCYNIKHYYMKHSQNWGVHSFQIDGQASTSSYLKDHIKGDDEVMMLGLVN